MDENFCYRMHGNQRNAKMSAIKHQAVVDKLKHNQQQSNPDSATKKTWVESAWFSPPRSLLQSFAFASAFCAGTGIQRTLAIRPISQSAMFFNVAGLFSSIALIALTPDIRQVEMAAIEQTKESTSRAAKISLHQAAADRYFHLTDKFRTGLQNLFQQTADGQEEYAVASMKTLQEIKIFCDSTAPALIDSVSLAEIDSIYRDAKAIVQGVPKELETQVHPPNFDDATMKRWTELVQDEERKRAKETARQWGIVRAEYLKNRECHVGPFSN